MAYSNVGTPVFYIDNYLYHKTVSGYTLGGGTSSWGAGELTESYHGLDCANQKDLMNPYSFDMPVDFSDYNFSGSENMSFYLAFLNHSLRETEISQAGAYNADIFVEDTPIDELNPTDVFNFGISGTSILPRNGSSILTSNEVTGKNIEISLSANEVTDLISSFKLGSISCGIKYKMPYSPDLNVNMSIDFDGITNMSTSGGNTISNINYSGAPLWYSYLSDNSTIVGTNQFETWEDSTDVQFGARRNGRKTWTLSFSFIADNDLFSSNQRATKYTNHPSDSTYEDNDLSTGEQSEDNDFAYNIETDDSFYAQVWNKTLGGGLPFIFQPDSNNNDDFYICRFDSNTLSVEQVAYKAYNMSVTIVESW